METEVPKEIEVEIQPTETKDTSKIEATQPPSENGQAEPTTTTATTTTATTTTTTTRAEPTPATEPTPRTDLVSPTTEQALRTLQAPVEPAPVHETTFATTPAIEEHPVATPETYTMEDDSNLDVEVPRPSETASTDANQVQDEVPSEPSTNQEDEQEISRSETFFFFFFVSSHPSFF